MSGAYFEALHRKLDQFERAARENYGVELGPRVMGPTCPLVWCPQCATTPMRPRLDGLFTCPSGHLVRNQEID